MVPVCLSAKAAKQKILFASPSFGIMWGHWLYLGGIHLLGLVGIGSFCYCELSGFLPVGASFCPWRSLGTGQGIFALNPRA